jgi:hypothetical protein
VPNDIASLFAKRHRAAVTDGAKENLATEGNLGWERKQELGDVAENTHFLCITHKGNAINKKMLELDNAFISGLIHVCLAFRGSGCLDSLRKIARNWMASNFHFERWEAENQDREAREADAYRHRIIDMFLPKSQGRRAVRLASYLRRFATGNWKQRFTFEHICRGCCRGRGHALAKAQNILLPRLLQSFRMFGRNNFTGANAAVADTAVPILVHGLLIDCMVVLFTGR